MIRNSNLLRWGTIMVVAALSVCGTMLVMNATAQPAAQAKDDGNKTGPATDGKAKVDFSGLWVNEMDSRMDLQIDKDGKVTGTYQTGKGAPKPEVKFPLVGWVSGDQLSFTVNFAPHGTLTSWVGQLTEDKKQTTVIKTVWVLSSDVADDQEGNWLWKSVATGTNDFRRETK